MNDNIIDYIDNDEKIIDVWGRRNPKFEKRYEQSVIRILADYGIGASEHTDAKGKILGAGYEPYIMAFFIGLYANKKIPLTEEAEDVKDLGQPLDKWGNLDSKKLRKAYPKLREYIFISLVAKTPIDWIALDKGEIKVADVVRQLIKTMEEYANYGFSVMADKLESDKGYFFSKRAFLDIFMELTDKDKEEADQDYEVEPL